MIILDDKGGHWVGWVVRTS